MALYPSTFNGQDRLQPGGRGEMFEANMPGHRDQGDRINRTNNKLNTSQHDVPNIKYQFDYRLPVLFRYGYAHGFNQMVIPKGRIVGVDPYMDLLDFDMKKQHNTLTMANGGAPVILRAAGDKYPAAGKLISEDGGEKDLHNVGKEWAPLRGVEASYDEYAYRPFAAPLAGEETVHGFKSAKAILAVDYKIDEDSGRVKDKTTGEIADDVRPGNIPIGMMQRNEYTRDDDALNGMMPGPVLTDALVELPWFGFKDKAEENPWGAAYGVLTPGALVKSDENGRVVLSPLSDPEMVATMSLGEYEAERQQVLGQIYAVNQNMLPEGSARWATWALEDRLNFDEFNPAVYRENNRRGEDAINNSPHNSTGEYPGYPYDRAYKDSDLHMLASTGRLGNYDARLNQQYQIENLGIPGLTDGKNAVVRKCDPHKAGVIKHAGDEPYQDMFFRTLEVDVEDLEIKIGAQNFAPVVVGSTYKITGFDVSDSLEIKYADAKQGIIVIKVIDKEIADAALTEDVEVQLKYSKRGLAGVPTFMDWDGCVGSVKILLTK